MRLTKRFLGSIHSVGTRKFNFNSDIVGLNNDAVDAVDTINDPKGWGHFIKETAKNVGDTAKNVGNDVQDAMVATTVSQAVKCLVEAVNQCEKEEALYAVGMRADVSVTVSVGPVSVTLTGRTD